jgi:hypothetical protein
MLQSVNAVVRFSKQLQALAAAVPPYLVQKGQLLPFVSSTVLEEMWIVSAIFSMLGSAILFNLRGKVKERSLVCIGVGCFCVAFTLAIFLIYLTSGLGSRLGEVWLDFLVRCTIIAMFTMIGCCIGWCVGVFATPKGEKRKVVTRAAATRVTDAR